jgi:hypothetical protein
VAKKPAPKKPAVKTKDLPPKKSVKGGARISKSELIKLQ